MSGPSVALTPRAMEVGEPQRKWYIVPRELPVPAPEALPEALPVSEPAPVESEPVPAG
jgi:hypothetical protein